MNQELTKRMVREYFDSIDVKFRSVIQRDEEREAVIEWCEKAKLEKSFIEELKMDADFKSE